MKLITCFCIAFCFAGQILHAQVSEQKKFIVFKTTVIDDNNVSHHGFLATMDDSTLYLSPQKFALTFEKISLKGFKGFNYNQISVVNLQRKGSTGRAMIIGGVTGLLVGAIIGASQPVNAGGFNTIARPLDGIIGAAIGGGIGCLLGAAISTLSKKVFVIGQQKEKLNNMRKTMISRLY